MSEHMHDRVLQLLDRTSLKELAEVNSKEYVRWQSVKRGRARISTEEIEQLAKLYPNYQWWIITGEVMPDKDQTSPEYDEANRNLSSQSAG